MEEVFEDEPGVIMRVMLSAPTGGEKGNMGTVDQLCGGSEADVELLEFFDIVADG